jgi:hypothetical protein
LALVSLVLCSCGGSGGDGGDGTEPVAIDPLNAREVAENVVGPADFFADVADVMPDLLTEVAEAGAPRQAGPNASPGAALSKLGRITLLLADEGTVDCADGGSYQFTVNDVPPEDVLSQGDAVSYASASCGIIEDGETITVNGAIAMAVTTASGMFPAAPYDLTVSITFQETRVNVGNNTIDINGVLTLSRSTTDGVSFETTLNVPAGSTLVATVAGPEGQLSVNLSGYTAEFTSNDNTGAYTFQVSGSVSSSEIGGSVTFETITPFSGVDPDDPEAGELRITGAGGSTLAVVALNRTEVELQLDETGDGVPEEVIATTWAELD